MKLNGFLGWLAVLMVVACGCETLGGKHNYTSMRLFLQTSPAIPKEERTIIVLPNPPISVTVARYATITEMDLVKATAFKSPTRKQILLEFDKHGTLVLETFTSERKGELFVITFNNLPVAAPAIKEIIRSGKLLIDVDMTDEELDKTVKGLNGAAKKSHDLPGAIPK